MVQNTEDFQSSQLKNMDHKLRLSKTMKKIPLTQYY